MLLNQRGADNRMPMSRSLNARNAFDFLIYRCINKDVVIKVNKKIYSVNVSSYLCTANISCWNM